MAIEFVIDAQDRKRIMKMLSAESASRIGSVMFKAFQQAGAKVEGRLKDNVRGPILKVRSGRLMNSIGSRAEVHGDQVIATIGSGARNGAPIPYAEIHETGLPPILPKNGRKYLTIPTREAKTLGGDTKGGFTAANLRDGQLAGFKGSVIIGKMIYGIMAGGKNKLMPLFILVKRVDMPARRYVSRTLEQSEKEIPNMVIEAVAKELRSMADGN